MSQITVSDIPIEVIRKNIKNLHLSVHPPNGRVRIATPLHLDDESVRLFAVSKLSWIKKKKNQFTIQERESEREYVSGESHYYKGIRYLLNVIYRDEKPKVEIRNKTYIDLYVRPGSSKEKRKEVLNEWYRASLKADILPLLEKWQPIIGVSLNDWGVKQMKTRWGTCSQEAKRIWLNLELAKKSTSCLEYIIVHELTHFLERHHNERFKALMNEFMPKWRSHREELNKGILGYENWSY
jgi:predicted metal-dependent hydrolase